MFKKTITLAVVALVACLAMTVHAEDDATWINATTGDWDVGTNWNDGSGPSGAGADVDISTGGTCNLDYNTFSVDSLSLDYFDVYNGSTLNILPGALLWRVDKEARIGHNSSVGTVVMTGGEYVGGVSTYLGEDPGNTGYLYMSGTVGTAITDSNFNVGGLVVGKDGGHGEFYMSGGTYTSGGDLTVGREATGTIEISGNSVIDTTNGESTHGIHIGTNDGNEFGTGTFRIIGDTATIDTHDLYIGGPTGEGTLELVLEGAAITPINALADAFGVGHHDGLVRLKPTSTLAVVSAWDGTTGTTNDFGATYTIINYRTLGGGGTDEFGSVGATGNGGTLNASAYIDNVNYGDGTDDAVTVTLKALVSGDADLSGKVDSDDASIINTNWLQSGKNWFTGDFDGNGDVDSDDASEISANWLVEADAPVAGTATATYDADTGEVRISADSVSQVGIRSDSHGLGTGTINWLNTFTLHEDSLPERVIETLIGANIPGPTFSTNWEDFLFFTAPSGIAEGEFDFQVRYQAVGGEVTFGDVEYIPEPGTLVLLVIGALGLLVWRRR